MQKGAAYLGAIASTFNNKLCRAIGHYSGHHQKEKRLHNLHAEAFRNAHLSVVPSAGNERLCRTDGHCKPRLLSVPRQHQVSERHPLPVVALQHGLNAQPVQCLNAVSCPQQLTAYQIMKCLISIV